MRNKHGVEVKPGYWAWYTFAGKSYEGRVQQTMSIAGDVHALILRDGKKSGQADAVRLNQVMQVLPPMRRTRGGVVKANPAQRDAGEFINLDGPKNARTRFFVHATDEWALSQGFPYRLLSQHGIGAPVRFTKTRAIVAIDEGADGSAVTETWRIRNLKFWGENVKRNPLSRVAIDSPSQRERTTATGKRTKRPSARLIERRVKTASTSRKGIYANPLTRVKVNSPSMATDEAPDARLLDRRKRTAKAPAGFYANPLKPSRERYHVSVMKPRDKSFQSVARFKLWEFAAAYGRALRNAHPTWTVKIEERT